MLIASLKYLNMEEIDRRLEEHRAFLRKHFEAGSLLCSGGKVPRDGGIVITHKLNRQEFEALLRQDPFYVNKVADFEVIEFNPVLCTDKFKAAIE